MPGDAAGDVDPAEGAGKTDPAGAAAGRSTKYSAVPSGVTRNSCRSAPPPSVLIRAISS